MQEGRGELLQAAQESRASADRAAAIVRDLRVFARPPLGVPTPVDVNEVLEAVLRMADNELRHAAKLKLELDTLLPPVMVDRAHLLQVLLGLVINATQAIGRNAVDQNRIRAATRLSPAGEVLVEIGDTGEGMTPEVLAHATDPFFTTRKEGLGTGLGLAVSTRLIAEAGGHLELTSEPGQGTTATVVLPAAGGPPPEDA
jgi:C4-dicarboxylate-specific signal transduction histidine kinase